MYCNLLTNKLPQHTDSGLRIRTDFRESIKFELLMQDRDIEDERKRESPLDIHKSHILKYLPYEQKYDANSNRKMEDPL